MNICQVMIIGGWWLQKAVQKKSMGAMDELEEEQKRNCAECGLF